MTIKQSPVTILGDLIEQLESDIDWYEISTSEALARTYAALAVRIKGADSIRQDVLDIVNELEAVDLYDND